MVQYARFQRTIVDDAGNILAGAKVEVRSEATGSLATLYADRTGAAGLSNPVTADVDGFAYFHVAGGAYKIRAYTGSSGAPTYEKIWRYEGIGRGSEVDNLDGTSAGTTRTLNLGGSPLDTTIDPGAAGLTFNNTTIANVTEVAIDVLNLGGGNEADWLAALGSGASTNKSRLEIRNSADPLVDFAIFDVTAAAVQGSPATFYRLTITHVASGGTLSDDQTVNITSAPAGSKGDLGSDGTDPGVLLNWDTGTSDADPGAGDIRADNADLGSASFLYVSLTSRAGSDLTTFLASLGRSTNTVRLGGIILTRPSDDTQAIFDLDSVAADGSPATYYKLGISNHSGAAGFSAADAISFQFTADGNAGSDGAGAVDDVNGYTGNVVLEAVDVGALAGLSVRVATTANITISTALNNGDTLDGVSLVTGDLVLVKDQSGGSPDIAYENGIYVVGASPARHARFADYDPHCGALVTVREGTVNADTQWQCTSNTGGTIETTAIAFAFAGIPGSVDVAPQGRLTLTTGTPILESDVTAAVTLYYTPYIGNLISLYDGSAWRVHKFAELSLSLSGYTANKNYDIWAYSNAGVVTLDSTVWTDDTNRATALTRQDGVLVKSGDAARRYLGTIRITNTTGQCEVSFGGLAAGGDPGWIGVWNMYNRVSVAATVQDSTDSGAYTTGTWRPTLNSANNRVSLVRGLNEDMVSAVYSAIGTTTSATGRVGVGVNSTTAYTGATAGINSGNAGASQAVYKGLPGRGFHYFQALEYGATGVVIYGDAGASASWQNGFFLDTRY